MKFTGTIVFPELLGLPETGSPEWAIAYAEYLRKCELGDVLTMVVCPSCGWMHDSGRFTACMSCNGPVTKIEYGHHEAAAVLEEKHKLVMKFAGPTPMVLR